MRRQQPSLDVTRQPSPNTRRFLRIAWLLLTGILAAIFVAGTGPRVEELRTVCIQTPCAPLTLEPEDARALATLGLSIQAYAIYHIAVEIIAALAVTLVAGVIFLRKFDDRMGVLTAFALVLFALNFMVESDSALIKQHASLAAPHDLLTAFAIVPFVMIFFLFPTGRFVPRWTRIVTLILIIVALADPLLKITIGENPSGQFSMFFLFVVLGGLLTGIFAQVYRYRYVSSPTERQQTKWVIFGLALLLVVILGWSFFVEIFPSEPGMGRLVFNLPIYGFMATLIFLFPVFFAFAILRYRLWDIDIIVRRTLVYALLTILLAGVYFGSVTLLTALFSSWTGQQSALSIVASTLLIASLFTPLRRRLQEIIDRRFFRKKYDAQQVLSAFAQTARDETDLDILIVELTRVVEEAVQPKVVSLWLTPEGRSRWSRND